MNKMYAVARKELRSFFASPAAFIFLGSFLLVTLFSFFWVEAFFARNIVDVRPLFEWMPLLLVFLVAAITMRMWSEERRMGTFEFLMTMPVPTVTLVIGKFLACVILVGMALVLTLGVPLTVSLMGPLDWGPVIGAYLASLLLASAYVAMGLFVSARSDNQLVALIGTVLIGLTLYLLGSSTLSALVGSSTGELLGLLSTGFRFESITRGVIDIRDLYYYLSLAGVFLALTTYSLEKLKWAQGARSARHGRWRWFTALFVLNLVVGNMTLHPVRSARVDFTEGQTYTISDATRSLVGQLREPLLMRGYFSSQTHPLLAPLVPQIRDLLLEYEVAGAGGIRAEFLDPRDDAALEEEANRKYNIRPMPFQVSEKYKESLVNSYFAVLIEYGDQYEILDFRELIEVKAGSSGEPVVRLRNLEYDLTRAIKKVLYGFQTTDSLFASLNSPVEFVGYVSPQEVLPEGLQKARVALETVLQDFAAEAGEQFRFTLKDPQAGDGSLAEEIAANFGFRPMAASLFDPARFYFYMTLQFGEETIALALPENPNAAALTRGIEAGLKRFSKGFLKTVGVVAPPPPRQNPMMPGQPQGRSFRLLEETLRQDYTVRSVSLDSGVVPGDIDILMVLAPEAMTEKQVFALDQFLMKGGTTIVSTGVTGVSRTMKGMQGTKVQSGLTEWLAYHGITLTEGLVLDPVNEPYPVPVRRNLGGFSVEEIQLVPYLPFPELRGEALNEAGGITGGIPQVTMNWASPIEITAGEGRSWQWILKSSKESSLGSATSVEPDFAKYPDAGFAAGSTGGSFELAGVMEGTFTSFFEGKDSPLLQGEEASATDEGEGAAAAAPEIFSGVLEKSTGSGRLLVFASNEFLTDQVMQISAATGANRYLNTLQLLQNAVDWSLEDRSLLAIRGRAQFSRTIPPMEEGEKVFWEYLNYGLVLFGLLLLFLGRTVQQRARTARYAAIIHAPA